MISLSCPACNRELSVDDLTKYAWITVDSQRRTHPVGELQKNPWGLCDLHGNVWEWCQDVYTVDYYKHSPKKDPPGPADGDARVLRGGSWYNGHVTSRSTYRNYDGLGNRAGCNGFRVLLQP